MKQFHTLYTTFSRGCGAMESIALHLCTYLPLPVNISGTECRKVKLAIRKGIINLMNRHLIFEL